MPSAATCYLFDKSGVYSGAMAAPSSPLEPGHYLYPENSTTIVPPVTAEKEVPVWNGKKWNKCEDHRGETRYSTAAENLGQPVEVKEVGPIEEVAPYSTSTLPPADIPVGHKLVWSLAVWGFEPLPPPTPAQQVADIRARLEEIDRQSVRPLRAIAAGDATQNDLNRLKTLESEASEHRQLAAAVIADNVII